MQCWRVMMADFDQDFGVPTPTSKAEIQKILRLVKFGRVSLHLCRDAEEPTELDEILDSFHHCWCSFLTLYTLRRNEYQHRFLRAQLTKNYLDGLAISFDETLPADILELLGQQMQRQQDMGNNMGTWYRPERFSKQASIDFCAQM
uniref:Uncharacterized protein n=1 Tax=Steinernema glaseri TaxID=37863 RepID=A0A1I7YJT7_9BILA